MHSVQKRRQAQQSAKESEYEVEKIIDRKI
jgi:hypothetical protein